MGGYSSEYQISLKSGNVVYRYLDTDKFETYRIHILKDKWKIPEDNDEFFGLLGELMAVYSVEKQKVLELSTEKVVPALTRLLESV